MAFRKGRSTTDTLLYLDYFISSSILTRNHVSILSIDFEAFDRIGLHVILKQLTQWKVGPKMFKYVKSFLTNRHFRITTNAKPNATSVIHNLPNGIPQGSPLSVVLFIIAFNEISNIINCFNKVHHVLYADALILFSNCKNLTLTGNFFSVILNRLSKCGNTSGALISVDKSQTLHTCKQINCSKHISVQLNDKYISNANCIKVLGLLLDSKCNFNLSHCTYIKKNLTPRVNIVKYLSSKNSFCNINTVINIIRCIILSKIDYSLAIYGKCSKSRLQFVSTSYHGAIRTSLRAFRTTPILNLLTEAGLPQITERINLLTFQIIQNINSPLCSPIHDVSKSLLLARFKNIPPH